MDKKINILIIFSLFFLFFKIIAIKLTTLGLHGDEAQYWLWSKDLDFGYFSKPPVLPYLIRFFSVFFGDGFFGIKILPVLVFPLTSFVIFLLSQKLFNYKIGVVCALTFFLLPGVSLSSFIVSTDVLLLLFWPLTLYIFLFQVEKPSIILSITLGLSLACGFLTKYAMVYFFICTLFYLLIEKEFFRHFINNIKYYILVILVFLLGISPNIYWNIHNDWVTLAHTANNVSLGFININFNNFYQFLISQIFIIGPLFFLTVLVYFKKTFSLTGHNIFLISYSLPILLLIFFESLIVRAHGNWAAVSYICLSILFVANIYTIRPNIILFNNIINLLTGFVFFYLILTSSNIKVFNQLYGYEDFSKKIESKGLEIQTKNIVIQERMIFALLSYHLKNTHFTLYTPLAPDIPVSHHFQLTNSLPVNFNNKFLYIGEPDQLFYLSNIYDIKSLGKTDINSKTTNVEIYIFTPN